MQTLIENRKATFNYTFVEQFNAGIELLGFEVKSLRKKQGSLEGSYIIMRGGEAYLIGAHIPPYQVGNTPKEYDERRNRRLLLTKKEIIHLTVIEGKKGLTIVPISVYNKGSKLKVDVAIAKGKKKFDKRETLKKHDTMRDMARDLKDRWQQKPDSPFGYKFEWIMNME